jgi:hypothetical protein
MAFRCGGQVPHAVPLTAKLAGAVSLLVNVPVKPIVSELPGAIVAL